MKRNAIHWGLLALSLLGGGALWLDAPSAARAEASKAPWGTVVAKINGYSFGPFWFQLYVMRNRGFVERLIGRAKQAQCSALVVTLDLPMAGQRHKVSRNGISVPPRLMIANLIDMAMKPKWCLEMLRTRRRSFGNLVGHVDGVSDMTSLLAWIDQQFDPRLSWDDIAWIRRLWDKKLVLKGIMDAEDARRAVDAGADAIVVSNHGGRQLDGAPAVSGEPVSV